ncbi:MAG: hypothetical protein DWQ45_00600 [Planctomycetota bacterium]|nr:MAG: hypothetical protein DWQ41_21445 [Planctomycetota bacterium]REK40088.1 MAG: hypothetical protein DWQ45_00600 [Planctomycetota bacterium]
MRIVKFLSIALVAVGLTYLFWRPLWHGGGLVGGDIYTYYFPQKTFYAEELRAGRISLWNPLVGHGYPVVAESQTGVFYPPNLLLYRVLDVNTAYNASQLGHYVLAVLFTWLLGRRMGLSGLSSLLTTIVFVYGWCAPRICLEWAILGGVFLPFTLWCAESFLQTAKRRYPAALATGLGLHLLAGHYNLAFIEVLTVLAYAALRVTFARDRLAESLSGRGGRGMPAVLFAIVIGFGLAAPQLLPTWQLKQRSQRADVGARHDPGYGHIPPWYLSQVVMPWRWYAPDVDTDKMLNQKKNWSIASLTNKVEAHLYFGLVPLALAVGGLLWRAVSGAGTPRVFQIWVILGLAATVYTTGWLLPVTRHLPGFSFFMGPGRYGIVTTLAVGLLAGYTLDRLFARKSGGVTPAGKIVIAAVIALTTFDLWVVRIHWNRTVQGEPNWYADLIPDPPINHRPESIVRQILNEYPSPVRMQGSFQNMPTLTGFAMTPTYLGLGPAEYYDPELTIPKATHDPPTAEEAAAQVEWMRWAGVTHILSERPLNESIWPVIPVWSGHDKLLHRAWALREPLSLYELENPGERVRLEEAAREDRAEVIEYGPERIVAEVDSTTGGEVVLTDLDYPGWDVTVDDQEAESFRADGMFRGVSAPPGEHTIVWEYRPKSVYWGVGIAAAALLTGMLLLRMSRRKTGQHATKAGEEA